MKTRSTMVHTFTRIVAIAVLEFPQSVDVMLQSYFSLKSRLVGMASGSWVVGVQPVGGQRFLDRQSSLQD